MADPRVTRGHVANILHQILDRSDFSPRTKSKYKLIIDRWITFAGPDPAGWTRERAQDWYDTLIASGIKAQSANVYAASLRYVSRWYATRTGNLDFALVQTRRGRDDDEDSGRRALSEDEVTALLGTCQLDSAQNRRDFTLIVVGLETGMRRMSLQAMTFKSLKVDGYPYANVPIKGPGGRRTFDVPLSDLTTATLDAWRAWLAGFHVVNGPLFPQLETPRPSKNAAPMSETQITRMIERRAKVAGIEHAHPHLLRHTFITTRTVAGLSAFQLAAVTGHKVPGMGAAATYIDVRAVANEARNSTPAWLNAMVRAQLASWA